jgi:hypothetical protein
MKAKRSFGSKLGNFPAPSVLTNKIDGGSEGYLNLFKQDLI